MDRDEHREEEPDRDRDDKDRDHESHRDRERRKRKRDCDGKRSRSQSRSRERMPRRSSRSRSPRDRDVEPEKKEASNDAENVEEQVVKRGPISLEDELFAKEKEFDEYIASVNQIISSSLSSNPIMIRNRISSILSSLSNSQKVRYSSKITWWNSLMIEIQASSIILKHELYRLKCPLYGFFAGLIDDDDPYKWEVLLPGPADTLYEFGLFIVHIYYPKEYPYRPPKVKFISEIWHPNIDKNGFVDIPILHLPGDVDIRVENGRGWWPIYNVESIMISVISMMAEPYYGLEFSFQL